MKLAIQKRVAGKKGETNKLRREGNIPAVLYGHKEEGLAVSVKTEDIQSMMRKMKSGRLATTIFELHDGEKSYKALIKDIQYHVATYDIVHLDFIRLVDDVPVTLNVPIQLAGTADCAGVKLGGFLRQVIRSLKVSCLPKDIPEAFSIDVANLELGQSKTLSEIEIPSNITPVAKMNEVFVIIGKKAGAA